MRFTVALGIILAVGALGIYYAWGDITGGDEAEGWRDITVTNMNALMIGSWAAIGGFTAVLLVRILRKNSVKKR